jgi:hypothetical protein
LLVEDEFGGISRKIKRYRQGILRSQDTNIAVTFDLLALLLTGDDHLFDTWGLC